MYRIEIKLGGTEWAKSAMTPPEGFCCKAAAALKLAQRLGDERTIAENEYRIVKEVESDAAGQNQIDSRIQESEQAVDRVL